MPTSSRRVKAVRPRRTTATDTTATTTGFTPVRTSVTAGRVEELAVGQPAPLVDQLPLHEGDVGRRPPEGRDAEPPEQEAEVTQPDGPRSPGLRTHAAIQPASTRRTGVPQGGTATPRNAGPDEVLAGHPHDRAVQLEGAGRA